MNKKVHIITLGCPKNETDSELLAGRFVKEGFALTNSIEDSDIVVVNTCGFILPAVEESIEEILLAAKAKLEGKVKVLAVTGCMVQRYGKKLMEEIPEIDILTGSDDHFKLPSIINNFYGTPSIEISQTPKNLFEELPHTVEHRYVQHKTFAYLRLAEGCSRKCAFCIIPALRGKMRSRPLKSILHEAKLLLDKGVKELVLIAQETTAYGSDLGIKNGLVKLLEKLLGLKGNFWIRLLYTHPLTINNELIEFYAQNASEERLVPYMDIPIQHISDVVLSKMNRGYTGKQVRNLVETLHKKVPNIVLRSTFLVGHPGETLQTFEELVNFIKEGFITYGGAFKFFAEEGAPASNMVDEAPDEEEAQEMKLELEAALIAAMEENLSRFENKKVLMLAEKINSNIEGRFWGQAPEIDGLTFAIPKNQIKPQIGEFLKVQVINKKSATNLKSFATTDLVAKVCK